MASSVLTTGVQESTEPYPWILNPVLDLLLCCGGLMLLFFLLLLMAPGVFSTKSPVGQAVVIFSLVVLSMPHGIASYLRVYNSPHTRKAIAKKVTILAVVCAAASFATLFSEAVWRIVGHITWYLGIQHLFAQSYGVALVYCYKRKFFWSKFEQKLFNFIAVQIVTINSVAIIFSHDNTYFMVRSIGPAWFPAWVPDVTRAVLYASLLLFVGVCVRKYLKERKILPFPALCCLIATYSYQSVLPILTMDPVLSAIAITPNLHLTQYIAITTSFHLKEIGLPKDVSFSQISSQLWKPKALKYFCFLLGAGFITSILIIPSIWKLGQSIGFDYGYVVLAVFVCINAHHYLTDSLIWKQRDPYVRKLLLA